VHGIDQAEGVFAPNWERGSFGFTEKRQGAEDSYRLEDGATGNKEETADVS
jgi:hypothetical protein